MAALYRVLYFAHAPFISGAERALMSMLRGLDRERFEPELILGCGTDLVRIARSMDIPVRIIPMPHREARQLVGWWRSLRAVERELERFRPHVVHANDVPSCQAMSVAAGRRGIPRVVHIRWPIDAASLGWWARSGCELILCVSRWIQAQLGYTAGTPIARARVSVVHDPISWTERAHGGPAPQPSLDGAELAARAAAFDARDWRAGQLRLGYAGQIAQVKGLDLVIRALAHLPADRRPFLLVAGRDTQTGGAYQRQLQDLATKLGVAERIAWLGFLDDVGQLYRQVHAVVCPSRVEPFGLVPLEAAEFAIPALANEVGGFSETIWPGETGYLVEPTVDAWVQALRSIVSPRQLAPLGVAARRRVMDNYSSAVYQDRLTRYYLCLLREQPAGQ